MMRRRCARVQGADGGQAAVEFIVVVLMLALLVATLVRSAPQRPVQVSTSSTVCRVLNSPECGGAPGLTEIDIPPAPPPAPARTAAAPSPSASALSCGGGGGGRTAVDAGERWVLQLPTNADGGGVDEVGQPELSGYSSDYYRDSADGGVVLRTSVGGETTPNSRYPRSELREMSGGERAAWSTSSGTHVMEVRTAVTQLPEVKDQGSVAQVHGGDDDLVQVRLHGSDLRVHAHLEGESNGVYVNSLDTDYVLGTPFDLRIQVTDGVTQVYYNGQLSSPFTTIPSDTAYFKAGAYSQANSSTDPPSSAYEVVIYDIGACHRG